MRNIMLALAVCTIPAAAIADRKTLPATICQFWPGENANQAIESSGEQVKGTGRRAMAVSQFGNVTNTNTLDTKVLGLVCPLIRDKPDKDYVSIWVYGFSSDCEIQSNTTNPCHSNSRAASTCVVRSRTSTGFVKQTAVKNLNRRVETSLAGPNANLIVGWNQSSLEVLDREAAVFLYCELGRNTRLDMIIVEEDR